ncbi:MAG: hypothetical protein ACI9GM_000419 [Salibacteraceae bacterium]|jgi:hypothetical protein
MRNWIVIVVLSIMLTGLSSCCKRSVLLVKEMSINYKNINDPVIVYHIRFKEDGFNVVIDTSEFELRTDNNHTIFIDFGTKGNHILLMADSSQTDTISNFSFNMDKCDEIENFGYYHNSIYKTDIRLEIE